MFEPLEAPTQTFTPGHHYLKAKVIAPLAGATHGDNLKIARNTDTP